MIVTQGAGAEVFVKLPDGTYNPPPGNPAPGDAPTNATLIQATLQGNGATAVLGNLMIIAEIPNQIGVFSINSDGSLSELSTAIIPQSNAGMFSLSVFPNSR